MAFFKNVASQKIAVFAYDSTDGSAKTGDAANISAQISKDGGAAAATNDAAPTELDAVDHPGVYLFDMLQAESNADLVNLTAVSSTASILLEPVFIYTEIQQSGDTFGQLPTNFVDLAIAVTTGVVTVGSLDASTAAQVEAECNDALVALHLDHAFAVDYDPASKPGVATALFNELIENNAGVSRYTAAALAQAPTGGAADILQVASGTIGAVGNDTTHLHLTGLTFGDDELNELLLIVHDVSGSEYHSRWITDWVLSTALATVGDDALPFTPQDSTDTYVVVAIRRDVDTVLISGAAPEDSADLADAVWLELLAAHSGTAGSAAEALAAAGTAGDPWVTALPGAYGAGTAGKIVGDNIDAAVSSRSAASVLGAAVGADISADIAAVKSVADGIPTTAMRGTDSAALASALGNPVGADISADLAGVKSVVDGIPTTAMRGTDNAATATALNTHDGKLDGVVADLPVKLTKNTAFTNFMFKMVDATNGYTAETGISVTATRSLDGAAFGACANAAVEVASGWYKIDLDAADLNGDMVVLAFNGTGCRATEVMVVTQAT